MCPAASQIEKRSSALTARKCALCAGSGAGGLLAGHAGCVVAPLLVAVTGLAPQIHVFAGFSSAAITGVALLLWRRLRRDAAPWERRIVIASAFASLAFCLGFHFAPHLLPGAAAAGPQMMALAGNICGTLPSP